MIELNPFGTCTVNIATSRTTAIGTVASGTKAPSKISSPADHLDQDRRPAQQERRGNANGVQYMNEGVRAVRQLGIAVFHEAEPDDETKRDGIPTARNRNGGDGDVSGTIYEAHKM